MENDIDVGLEPALTTVERMATSLVASLPLIIAAVLVLGIGIIVAVAATKAVRRTLSRTRADPSAVEFMARLVRILLVVAAFLMALAVAGVQVGPALAGLGIAGVAVAFAVQGIVENFFAGIILLIRKPFRPGDQIRTPEFEGTVQGIDLRVTRLIDYDGELVLIPNVEVYTNPVVNLTRLGKRRTRVIVGIDYRDDHDRARDVLREAVAGVEGVLDEPAPEVLLCELAESSVDFEVRFWTLPDIRSVQYTRDRVLSAAKRAVQDAGLTIPWPIRTLVVDGPVRLSEQNGAHPELRSEVHLEDRPVRRR